VTFFALITYNVSVRIEWNRYHVRLGPIGRNRWAQGVKVPSDWDRVIPQHDLWFVWAGKGRMHLRKGWVDLRPGLCVWMRRGWNYHATQDPKNPVGMNFIHFELVDARGKPRRYDAPLPPELIEPLDAQFTELTTRRIVELCFGFGDDGYSAPSYNETSEAIGAALLTGLLMELDAATDEGQTRKGRVKPYFERLIRQVALRITENPQHTPTVAALAREFGYSPNHFTRLFKAVTGQTPELFAAHSRIRRAQHLLRDTSSPIGEIATMLGYRDIYFFSRQFKQFIGSSPLHYRQNAPVP
jgi:AraC-like DNA-binding protein